MVALTEPHPLIAQLVQARQAAGLSQLALADRLDVTQTALSYWENGNRDVPLSQLTAWAEALDILLGYQAPADFPTMPRPTGPALMYVTAGAAPEVRQVDADGFDPGGLSRWDLAVCKALLDLALTKIEQHEREASAGVARMPEADRG